MSPAFLERSGTVTMFRRFRNFFHFVTQLHISHVAFPPYNRTMSF